MVSVNNVATERENVQFNFDHLHSGYFASAGRMNSHITCARVFQAGWYF